MRSTKIKAEVEDSEPQKRPVENVNAQCAKELKAVPEDVQDAIQFQLNEFVANGELPSCSHKKLRDDVMQMSFPYEGNTYRALYTTKEGKVVLLLIVFQKKTNGQATDEINLAQTRLKRWRTQSSQ